METLEEKSIKARMVQLRDVIATSNAELDKLKVDLAQCRQRHFWQSWKQNATDVLATYQEHVNSCCYQGGKGYKIWVPMPYTPCHWVVNPAKYAECQPTEMDKAAYYAIHGDVMRVPTNTHYEHWGN